jgi:hypothetical protein
LTRGWAERKVANGSWDKGQIIMFVGGHLVRLDALETWEFRLFPACAAPNIPGRAADSHRIGIRARRAVRGGGLQHPARGCAIPYA